MTLSQAASKPRSWAWRTIAARRKVSSGPGILAELAQQFDVSGLFTGDELAEWAQPSEPEAGAGGDEEEIDDPESGSMIFSHRRGSVVRRALRRGCAMRGLAKSRTMSSRFAVLLLYFSPVPMMVCARSTTPMALSVTSGAPSKPIARAWRGLRHWPVNERLIQPPSWLIRQSGELARRLETDPDYYDAKRSLVGGCGGAVHGLVRAGAAAKGRGMLTVIGW